MAGIGLKAGGITFATVLFAVFAALAGLAGIGQLQAAGIALFAGAAAFGAVWLSIRWMIEARFEALRKLMRAITEKQFDDLPELQSKGTDEIDEMLNEVAKAAETIEQEFYRLMRLENYRKEFIGDISHELKTPIFAIQGFVETLLDGALEDENVNRVFLEKAMKNVTRLTILTNDLMEIAKLETGELKSHIKPFYIADCVQEVQDTLQYRATEEDLTFTVQADEQDCRVMGDRNQLRQVMVNLVENAIKYNRPGGRVTLRVQSSPENDKKVQILVEDTGIGIAPEHLSRVTERFYRVDKSRSRGKGGTGLGLAIVKHILESHGSSLKAQSVPGEGSVFSFCLKKA
ncbi:MAG: hypothetical protein LAT75_04190 [Candidatus Cyclonatronum sp.]|uniref:sensor histidine kinase n=1 Tax=Cyclonatronum sp. TaxID=3024185 RepID=UPI0025BF7086|nr:ATP-binding protein [Cyclonatronum sp.]MCH8486040.1 hypothetical protein [Cyclonatronum sp.]